MKTLSTDEIKGLNDDILSQLARGEEFIITHNGTPVAQIVSPSIPLKKFPPLTEDELAERKRALEYFREFRKTHSLGGLTYRELIDEGRRY